jgi:hypothetical protein
MTAGADIMTTFQRSYQLPVQKTDPPAHFPGSEDTHAFS